MVGQREMKMEQLNSSIGIHILVVFFVLCGFVLSYLVYRSWFVHEKSNQPESKDEANYKKGYEDGLKGKSVTDRTNEPYMDGHSDGTKKRNQ